MIACFTVFIVALTLLEGLSTSIQKPDASSPAVESYPPPWLIRNSKLNTSSNSGWVMCNAPPRYQIPVTVQDCGVLYRRYAELANFRQRRVMHASVTPRTLSEEGDVCVIRLENYDRRQMDIFSDFDIFAAVFRALGRCIDLGYGGAASIGLMSFQVSVAGSIPLRRSAAKAENVTLSLRSQPVAATLEPSDTA